MRLDLEILSSSSVCAMGMAAESQFHVLAVDDSLFDRKLIERLLQKSSCQGKMNVIENSLNLGLIISNKDLNFTFFCICSNYC